MSYVISLEDYTPGQRYDDLPWTGARIDYATTRAGSYTAVETFTFDDPDDDPTAPKSRDLTTALAPVASAWFKVTFLDADANEQPSPPVYFPNPGARPSLADIGSILWARTKDNAGNTLGTFGTGNTPDGVEVEKLIDQGVADVAMRAGTIPEGLEDVAREAVALKVAATIERGYRPEQANDANSAYNLFRTDYLELMDRIIEATFDSAGGAKGVVTVPVTTEMAAPYIDSLP